MPKLARRDFFVYNSKKGIRIKPFALNGPDQVITMRLPAKKGLKLPNRPTLGYIGQAEREDGSVYMCKNGKKNNKISKNSFI